jgi:hypothetical protein
MAVTAKVVRGISVAAKNETAYFSTRIKSPLDAFTATFNL